MSWPGGLEHDLPFDLKVAGITAFAFVRWLPSFEAEVQPFRCNLDIA
jgi:hypothetical protein